MVAIVSTVSVNLGPGGLKASSLACAMKPSNLFIPLARDAWPSGDVEISMPRRAMFPSSQEGYQGERVSVGISLSNTVVKRMKPPGEKRPKGCVGQDLSRVVTKVPAKMSLFFVVLRSLSCWWIFRSLESSNSILLFIGVFARWPSARNRSPVCSLALREDGPEGIRSPSSSSPSPWSTLVSIV